MSGITNKVFVFDMDGVILQNRSLAKEVATRSAMFVKDRINRHMPYEKANKINKVLYTNFGHTVIGLNKVYDSNITLNDFNEYVYDYNFTANMLSYNREPDFFENNIKVRSLFKLLDDKGIPTYIFSNSPYRWCKNSLEIIGVNNFNVNNIIGCDNTKHKYDKDIQVLKPFSCGYETINGLFDDENIEIIFIDDQIQNLRPVINAPLWKPVLFNNARYMNSKNLHVINDIDELSMLV